MINAATTKYTRESRFAWVICGLVAIATLWQIGGDVLRSAGRSNPFAFMVGESYTLLPLAFSLLGALVITYQPRHIIGWLMMLPALTTFLDLFSAPQVNGIGLPPAEPTMLFLVAVFANRISWVLSVFPLLLILLVFPTGRPPTQAWNGLVVALLGLQALFLLVVGFGQHLLPFDETWSVANPIGFIPDEWVRILYSMLLQIVLGVLTLLCAVSLLVRYRQASLIERTQIKWIAYASALFGAFYFIAILTVTSTGLGWGSDDPVAVAVQLPTGLTLIALPTVIAIAMLRYRLFDIDIVIRRTLIYSVLTLALGATYFLSVVALQALFVRLTGQESVLAVVASTLGIAALFGPLRRWVQLVIDRRFFRQKYDARVVLEQFALRAQQQANLDTLAGDMLHVVNETVQPKAAQVWLVPMARGQQ